MPASVYVCFRRPEALSSMKLKLQIVVRYLTGVLGFKLVTN